MIAIFKIIYYLRLGHIEEMEELGCDIVRNNSEWLDSALKFMERYEKRD